MRAARTALALLVVAALAACSGPGGPALSELFDTSAAAEGTGIQGAGLVRAMVILARHQATAKQREVAEANARRAVAKMEREIAAAKPEPPPKRKPAPPAKPKSAPPKTKREIAQAEPEPSRAEPRPVEAEEPAAPKPPSKKRLPKRIAVRTVKDENTAPGAAAAVMIYDVEARRIVGNEVYDIEQEPKPGETVSFDTNVVRYVGVASY